MNPTARKPTESLYAVAAAGGSLVDTLALLAQGADLAWANPDADNKSALIAASALSDSCWLFTCGYVVTHITAIANAPLPLVEFLLQSGAPVNLTDKCDAAIVELLSFANAHLHCRFGKTALHYAASEDRPFIAWLLIRRGIYYIYLCSALLCSLLFITLLI